MIVIDNSALVEALVGQSPPNELLDVVSGEQLHAPHLLDYEFRNALRDLVLGKKISPSRAEGARTVKHGLALTRHPDALTGERAWDLRGNLNAYDATYVALAELLGCPLVTTDDKIARTARTVQVNLYCPGRAFGNIGHSDRVCTGKEAATMSVQLNHTIVASRDKKASAEFVASILGLEVGSQYGPFLPVETGNEVTLDFMDTDQEHIPSQHYAFLVSEEEFDTIFGRIHERGIPYYADPGHRQPGRINRNDGGRGAYFDDPNGHNLEIITRPYGSGG